MPLFDYRCVECDHISERNCHHSVEAIDCDECGNTATKVLLSAPSIGMLKMGVDTAFPSAADRWERVHRQEADKAKKKEMEFEREMGRKPSWYDKEVQ